MFLFNSTQKQMLSLTLTLLCLLNVNETVVNAFSTPANLFAIHQYQHTTTTTTTTLYVKGRKSRSPNLGKPSSASFQQKSESSPAKKTNWVQVKGISSMNDLPKEQNSVQLIDTMADQLINSATNPTGAVSILNYTTSTSTTKTFCFSSSCPSCKIPLSKAKVYAPNDETNNVDPRLSCDFCKATYNIRTGQRMMQNEEKTGFLGGVVTSLFAAQDKVPLPVYDLGEKNGQVFINLP